MYLPLDRFALPPGAGIPLPASLVLHDVELEGVVRLEFSPLVPVAPFFGGVRLSLVGQPRVSYTIS